MSYEFKERTDTWNRAKKEMASDSIIMPSDAGEVKKCDHCGFTYEIEMLVKDEYGFEACPTCLYEPEPKAPELDLED